MYVYEGDIIFKINIPHWNTIIKRKNYDNEIAFYK